MLIIPVPTLKRSIQVGTGQETHSNNGFEYQIKAVNKEFGAS
jgi:hypothetical protein